MNKLYRLPLSLVLLALGAGASPSQAAADNATETLRQVRRSLDEICPDTFCGGDINYRVNSVDCDFAAGECAVVLDFERYPLAGRRFPARRYACTLDGYRSLDDVATATAGRVRYSQRLYDDLLECLGQSVELLMPTVEFTRDIDLFGRQVPLNVPVECAGDVDVDAFFSDYFYALGFKKYTYATIALFDHVSRFAAANDCSLETVWVDARTDVQCIDEPISYPVCEIDLDARRAYVFKDYVDSTSVAILDGSPTSSLPLVRPELDTAELYLHEVEPCREALLDGFRRANRLEVIDATRWLSYYDLRFVASTAVRRVVRALSKSDSTCRYEPKSTPASEMVCSTFDRSGARLCTIPTLGSGYYHVLLSATGDALVNFNNYD